MAEIVTDDRQRLEQEIARKEETIQELRTIIRGNEEKIKKLEDGEEAQKEKIKALEAENKELGDKIKALEGDIKALKEEIDKLKNENESLEIKLEATNKRIDKLEKDSSNEKSLLIIIQIGTTIQRNICKYVLGKHFKESNFYKVKYLEKYIAKLKEPAEKKSARERWSALEDQNIWDESLVDSLKNLNQRRIGIAHPKLTSENIQQAMECLKEDPEFDPEMLDNICKLKKNWETTESLLRKHDPESANKKQVGGKSEIREQLQTALPYKRQRLLGSQDKQSMNEEELRKKEQELQEKVKEIEELKREKENVQHELQQQDQENKILTTRIEELKEEIEHLNAEIKTQKEELEGIKGNQDYLLLAAMCDQLQKNFYQIVFHPHDFSEDKQSYKERHIEYNINKGRYGLTTEEDKRQARERWSDLKKQLGWVSEDHVRGIKQLKRDRNPTANPKITKNMKESLQDVAKALNHERKLDEPTFGIVQNLIEMWFKTEDLVQEQEEKKNKEQRE